LLIFEWDPLKASEGRIVDQCAIGDKITYIYSIMLVLLSIEKHAGKTARQP